jgi:hypothetical protein
MICSTEHRFKLLCLLTSVFFSLNVLLNGQTCMICYKLFILNVIIVVLFKFRTGLLAVNHVHIMREIFDSVQKLSKW